MAGQSKTSQGFTIEIDALKTRIQELESVEADRKLAEKTLRESEATARTLLNIPDALAFLPDREGVILDASDTLAASHQEGEKP